MRKSRKVDADKSRVMNGKISEQNFKGKKDICITSKYPPQVFIVCGGFKSCPHFLSMGGVCTWPD